MLEDTFAKTEHTSRRIFTAHQQRTIIRIRGALRRQRTLRSAISLHLEIRPRTTESSAARQPRTPSNDNNRALQPGEVLVRVPDM